MKSFLALLILTVSAMASTQSLHFVTDSYKIPYQGIAGSLLGRIAEPRIDVLRTKYDWDTYFSAQSGLFGGPATTTIIQPDYKCEQVVAVCLGNDGTFGRMPEVVEITPWDDFTWEVVIDLNQVAPDQVGGKTLFSPYVAFRTPRGPNNYRFVFLTAEGRQVIDLRSPIACHRLPKDWWRCQDVKGRGGR